MRAMKSCRTPCEPFGGHYDGVRHLYLSDPSRIIVTLAKARVQSKCWGSWISAFGGGTDETDHR